MTSRRPWWAIAAVGMLAALTLGLGLGCGEDEGTTSTVPSDPDGTTIQVTTTLAATTTVPADVDIDAQLVGVWDCVELPGDYTLEFRADGTGVSYQQGEIGDIFTEFLYETDGYLVNIDYVDGMMQTLELSVGGGVLTEAGPHGVFSFERQ